MTTTYHISVKHMRGQKVVARGLTMAEATAQAKEISAQGLRPIIAPGEGRDVMKPLPRALRFS